MATFSESSKLTVGLTIAILTVAFWVGVTWSQVQDLRQKVDLFQSIDRRLSRIEGKLGVNQEESSLILKPGPDLFCKEVGIEHDFNRSSAQIRAHF